MSLNSLAKNGHPRHMMLASSTLQYILGGVATATKITVKDIQPVKEFLLRYQGTSKPLSEWNALHDSNFAQLDNNSRHLANLTLAVGFLHKKSKEAQTTSADELDLVWSLIYHALQSNLISQAYQAANRSAQGFLAVPLCSIVNNGNIELLFRFHVWLPDGQRGAPGFGIHSHQPFAQSWILVGKSTNHTYSVHSVNLQEQATHAKYALSWSSGRAVDTTYKTHQTYSKVVNTKSYVVAKHECSAVHSRNASYIVPSAEFHSSEVAPDSLHATLFVFDSSKGFLKDAPVLGPKDVESDTQYRNNCNISPTVLACMVESVRQWEVCMARGRECGQRGERIEAIEAFSQAQRMCETPVIAWDMMAYKKSAADELMMLRSLQDSEDRLSKEV